MSVEMVTNIVKNKGDQKQMLAGCRSGEVYFIAVL